MCFGVLGDVDVILVYSKLVEEKFVVSEVGIYCIEIMYNDFVIVGLSMDFVGLVGIV